MNAANAEYQGLVFAAHPTAHGFGWVVFESPNSVLDWGTASARPKRSARLIARFDRILKRYEPSVFVLEEFGEDVPRRGKNVRSLCREMLHRAACAGCETQVFRRSQIRACFDELEEMTRHDIAVAIADRLDELALRLPPVRTPWSSQDPRQSLFDAAAVALTYYAHTDGL
jgi:hypothetical protein